jgi:hypothetical protein
MPVSDKKSAAGQDDVLKQLRHESDALSARILLKLLADPGRKQRLLDFTRQVLAAESGDGFMKRLYAGAALRVLTGIVNSLAGNVSPESPAPECGQLLTTGLKIYNHQTGESPSADPEASARRVTEAADAFLANLDLGELNQALEGSHDQLIMLTEALAAMLQDNHLGKLSSLSPAAVLTTNLLVAGLNRFLRHMHDAPPDFVAGFVAGLINLLDAGALAELLNHNNELTRMLHIGSLLQGDGKTPVLETALTGKIREVLRCLDPEGFCKKETGAAGLKETVHKSLRRAMADHPEFTQKLIVNRAPAVNSRLRSFQATLTLLLDLPEEGLAQSMADALGALDAFALSEAINSVLALIRTVHRHRPGVMGKRLSDIVKTLDEDELTETATILIGESVNALKPLAAAVMPPLVGGLAELLAASMKDAPETTAASLSRLSAMMKSAGETT